MYDNKNLCCSRCDLCCQESFIHTYIYTYKRYTQSSQRVLMRIKLSYTIHRCSKPGFRKGKNPILFWFDIFYKPTKPEFTQLSKARLRPIYKAQTPPLLVAGSASPPAFSGFFFPFFFFFFFLLLLHFHFLRRWAA